MNRSPAPQLLLTQRGIAATAAAMQWQEGRNGWVYPVYDLDGNIIAKRFKAYDSAAKPKYLWLDDTKAQIYHGGPSLRSAIAKAGGVLYIATGEPAVLTLHAAGILNALSIFGDRLTGEMKGVFHADLLALGVQTVRYYPDKDTAGDKSAAALRDEFQESGMRFDCRALPAALPEKADLNDLWQFVAFDVAAFRQALEDAPPYNLPNPPPAPEPKPGPRRREGSPSAGSETVDWPAERSYWRTHVVLPALNVVAPVIEGKGSRCERRRCPNPEHAHGDRHPSLRISYDKSSDGIPVCSCSLLSALDKWDTLAGWCGVPDFMTWWRQERQPHREKARAKAGDTGNAAHPPDPPPATPPNPYLFPGGLVPVAVQKAINHFASASPGAALEYFLAQQGMALGIIPATGRYTPKHLEETALRIGWSVSLSTLYRNYQAEVSFLHAKKGEESGCSFENERQLLPIADVKARLKRMQKIELYVRFFRSKAHQKEDMATGKLYTLPPVAADLPVQAFIDAGMDDVSARRAAETLQDDTVGFDMGVDRQRAAATRKARDADADFCRSLNDPLVVPPSEEILIKNERTFKVALTRAWHAARIDGFTRQSDQMWGLGLGSKHTLNAYLREAGVLKEKQIEPVPLDPEQDIGKQVKANIQHLEGVPVTFTVIDSDGVKTRRPYHREAIANAVARGERVSVEYQRANLHHVVELPVASAASEQDQPRKHDQQERQQSVPRVKRTLSKPGTYPVDWTLHQLRYRYRLHHEREAPDAMSVSALVEALATDIFLRRAAALGAVVTELA